MSDSDDVSDPTPAKADSPPEKGEHLSPQWSLQWIDPIPVDAGTFMAPARITSPEGRQFAALHLIQTDLTHARDCLIAADKIGIPDSDDLQSKALIFSGVVAYARPFMTGVREIQLEPAFFSAAPHFDVECHNYLLSLRNKHIAHSVNEFERCEAVALVLRAPNEEKWRNGGAIGFIKQHSIGLNRDMLRASIAHIEAALAFLTSLIAQKRAELYAGFRAQFEADGKWEMAPIVSFPDRQKVRQRRPKK